MLPKKYAVLFFLSLISANEALRILIWFPFFAKSHDSLSKSMANHLLAAGHEVVRLTSYPTNEKRANLTEIDVSSPEKARRKQMESSGMMQLKNMVGHANVDNSALMFYMTYQIHRDVIEDETSINFLSDPNQKFDAVILEWFFSDFIAGIAPLFEAPLIWVGTTETHWQILRVIDALPNPAYSIDLFSLNRPPYSFRDRVTELWTMTKKYLMTHLIVRPFEKRLYNRVFPEIATKRGVALPSYEEASYNGSLMFLFSHPSTGTPFRLPQNVKYVGGYHIDSEVKPLPEDLQKLMDEAKHGVIYFSMGSNLKSAEMSDHMKQSLLQMFSRLKQTVIWKFEEDLPNVPANIHLMKWAPQQSILKHPNLKVFITHGGQLSTIEAVHFGVPVVGIPVYGDQNVNMKSAEQKGFSVTVTLAEDMADDVFDAIQEILNNPRYTEKAKELSAIYHDRPLTPAQEIVYWVEHVVRTKGARHLRSPGVLVPLYQILYLDLIALVLLVAIVSYIGLRKVLDIRGRRKVSVAPKSDKKVN